jgi:mRNA interferase YafQ
VKYDVKRTSQFKKDFKAIIKQGLDIKELEKVLEILINGDVVPEKYKDHPLRNSKDFKNCRELHIEPDWLLIYKYNNDQLILYLIRTGSHSDLF